MVTELDSLAPSEFEQRSVYVFGSVSAPVDCEPVNALLPLHAPSPAQLLALVLLQLSVDSLWYAMDVGLALSDTCGTGSGAGGGVGWLAHLNPATMAQPGFVGPVRAYAPTSDVEPRDVPLKSESTFHAAAAFPMSVDVAVGQTLRPGTSVRSSSAARPRT
jgi:hypothetical protein